MSARHDEHRTDWRTAKPGHQASARRLPKNVRKALRDYRRKVIPMAEPARSKWLYRVGIACGLVIAFAILWARSQGLMP